MRVAGAHSQTSLPLGALALGWFHGHEDPLTALRLWDFLKAILIASAFEFAVVTWIWPAELDAWEREEAEAEKARHQPKPEPIDPEDLREYLEQDLQREKASRPYMSFS